ncbi:MAG TPA: SUMF1/EgtB/PvdO family nonheme iron enzyme, partial [Planctomycetota bacterium]|nr:SUMF1/EgtB/PvdO family nonheme iron enzyme [Planctomycetota bacterium]
MKRASRKHPNTCHRGARSGFWWLGATLVGALWGCAPETLEQLPIERLAFVPGGQITVGSATIASRIPLLVDRFEITWEEWDGYVAATGSGDLDGGTLVPSGPPEHPAVGMDLAAAEAFAAWRSMRLPTVSEWLWIAAGPRAMT